MSRLIFFCVLAFCVAGASAGPAPWYAWRSVANGKDACSRTSPGEGWRQVGGPFVDAACKRPLRIVRL